MELQNFDGEVSSKTSIWNIQEVGGAVGFEDVNPMIFAQNRDMIASNRKKVGPV
jgi:hypothetical protein